MIDDSFDFHIHVLYLSHLLTRAMQICTRLLYLALFRM